MKFIATSRSALGQLGDNIYEAHTGRFYKIEEPFIIVSVKNPNSEDVLIPDNVYCRGVLRLCFHDCDVSGLVDGKPVILISDDNGKQIVNFFNNREKDVGMVIAQCEAGMSRSAGIVAALSKIFLNDDERFFRKFMPNRFVYRAILKAAMP